MNSINTYTTDPTIISNYVINASVVDPKRGTTPEEIKKYTHKKVAAIIIKIFIAIATAGISALINFGIIELRAYSHDGKAIESAASDLNLSDIAPIRLCEMNDVLPEARRLALMAGELKNNNENKLNGYALTACRLKDRYWGKSKFTDDEIKVVARVLIQTVEVVR